MYTVLRGLIDKAAWERGPWDDEPDKVLWRNTDTGLTCLAVRHPEFGYWCGYVAVPEGHPLFGKSGEDCSLDVHGGVTYSGGYRDVDIYLPGPHDPKQWWFGFDCAHAFDLAPGIRAILKRAGAPPRAEGARKGRYRDIGYVRSQCAGLARQLIVAGFNGSGSKGHGQWTDRKTAEAWFARFGNSPGMKHLQNAGPEEWIEYRTIAKKPSREGRGDPDVA